MAQQSYFRYVAPRLPAPTSPRPAAWLRATFPRHGQRRFLGIVEFNGGIASSEYATEAYRYGSATGEAVELWRRDMRRIAMVLTTASLLAVGMTATRAQAHDGWWGYPDWRENAWREHAMREWAWRRHWWHQHHYWQPTYYNYGYYTPPAYYQGTPYGYAGYGNDQ
jgi:hypothetical protein